MNAAAESPPAGLAGSPPPGAGLWTHRRWLAFVALVFVAHVLLLFVFGGRKQIVPRAVTNIPAFSLADNSSEWLALNDPTLFALPHQKDFASAVWLPAHVANPPSFRWTGTPRWLPLSTHELGLAFNQFMRTNRFANIELELKPPVKPGAPPLPVESALAQPSTLQIQGGLAHRRWLNPLPLPSLPYNDVIAPSQVQVLVDAAGDVISAVLLPPDSGFAPADQYDLADQRALDLARAARFAPASSLTVGRMTFNWQTVPVTGTNEPSH